MSMFDLLDELQVGDERFQGELPANVYSCDFCLGPVQVPFKHIPPASQESSLDICGECADKEISYRLEKTLESHANCTVCKHEILSLVVWTVVVQDGAVCHVCESCSRKNVIQELQARAVLVDENYSFTHLNNVPLSLAPVNRRVPDGARDLIKPRHVRRWLSLLEDLCHVPATFGSLKAWTIFRDTVPFLYDSTIDYLVDCSAGRHGRVAVAITTRTCQTHVYIIAKSWATYSEQRATLVELYRGAQRGDVQRVRRDAKQYYRTGKYRKLAAQYAVFLDIYNA